MISGVSGGASNYLRQTPMPDPTQTFTPADAQPDAPAAAPFRKYDSPLDVSQLKRLDLPKPTLLDSATRDRLATNWLRMQQAIAPITDPDNASENTYAQIKVDGKVVVTLYNSGGAELTNGAWAKVSDLQNPPGVYGPNGAQWRAEAYARALGGTVEMAPTALTQSQWTPTSPMRTDFTREELDAALAEMRAEGERAAARAQASYNASLAQAGTNADFSA